MCSNNAKKGSIPGVSSPCHRVSHWHTTVYSDGAIASRRYMDWVPNRVVGCKIFWWRRKAHFLSLFRTTAAVPRDSGTRAKVQYICSYSVEHEKKNIRNNGLLFKYLVFFFSCVLHRSIQLILKFQNNHSPNTNTMAFSISITDETKSKSSCNRYLW